MMMTMINLVIQLLAYVHVATGYRPNGLVKFEVLSISTSALLITQTSVSAPILSAYFNGLPKSYAPTG